MKIFLIGAAGTLGSAIAAELGERHEIITGGRSSGDINIDLADALSIRAAFEKIGSCDAVVSATGKVKFAPLASMTAEDYAYGIANKLMSQVNLVLIGRGFVSDGGSFTLTTGVLAHDPIRSGTSASMVNGALDSFVRAAAIELPRGLRINSVSPGVFVESMAGYGPFFRGHEPVPVARAARAFSKSVEGALTGQVFSVL
ncbi:short chain dehydrogenase [Kaistia dalseonensis]|uniref:NAD(P)-dependent dehydrogenase (Short-subunit alcohol dehydrogenase family) n=1 Tax=Kaistia dalseonensis TaxID=410840 RepID=A0ABU0H123_9HYPH|nr:short chain dehydrogenase [Kaistia dalseonensis]MCX5493455.1 short chain dehydrogenase [Kaistia dalseonensis]MDQ0436014.1 NAD(P)-dependent dehydrogenase (short-subunit alcohol dehydrogenase family) [Kaistia dalseonensis]